jgi:hypothetical protein
MRKRKKTKKKQKLTSYLWGGNPRVLPSPPKGHSAPMPSSPRAATVGFDRFPPERRRTGLPAMVTSKLLLPAGLPVIPTSFRPSKVGSCIHHPRRHLSLWTGWFRQAPPRSGQISPPRTGKPVLNTDLPTGKTGLSATASSFRAPEAVVGAGAVAMILLSEDR